MYDHDLLPVGHGLGGEHFANKSRRRDAGCNQLLVSRRSKWPVLVLLPIIQQALAQESGNLPQW